jgi:hypothetical protein
MDVAAFLQNRAKFPLDELQKYDGQWVAFSADGARIVASAETLDELERQLAAAGENAEELGLEQVTFRDYSDGGGAGLV